jgi:hypothetical protein
LGICIVSGLALTAFSPGNAMAPERVCCVSPAAAQHGASRAAARAPFAHNLETEARGQIAKLVSTAWTASASNQDSNQQQDSNRGMQIVSGIALFLFAASRRLTRI